MNLALDTRIEHGIVSYSQYGTRDRLLTLPATSTQLAGQHYEDIYRAATSGEAH
jgi:hypothetical protein